MKRLLNIALAAVLVAIGGRQALAQRCGCGCGMNYSQCAQEMEACPDPGFARWRQQQQPQQPQQSRNYIVADPAAYAGKVVGSGQCVDFVKSAAKLPATADWRPGALVKGRQIPKGTPIATFVDGKYPQSMPGDGRRMHAAIYDGQDADGIWVWDQWKGQSVIRRHIRFRGGTGSRSNDGDAFSVISVVER